MCIEISTIEFQNIFVPCKRNPGPMSSHSLIPLPQPSPCTQHKATTCLLCVSMYFTILSISCKWIHTITHYVVVCIWLLSMNLMFSKFMFYSSIASFFFIGIFYPMYISHFLYPSIAYRFYDSCKWDCFPSNYLLKLVIASA